MSEPLVIAYLEKNARERVRVSLNTWQSANLLDIRVVMNLGEDGAETPTKKGLSVRIAQLGELRAALDAAEAEARGLGWI